MARSIEEAGLELLTYYDFPKTMSSFGTEAAAVTLLYRLVAFGQIVLRRIDGHEQLPAFLAKEWSQAV